MARIFPRTGVSKESHPNQSKDDEGAQDRQGRLFALGEMQWHGGERAGDQIPKARVRAKNSARIGSWPISDHGRLLETRTKI